MEECSYSITDSRILLQKSIVMPLAFKISRFSRTITHHEAPEINTFIYLFRSGEIISADDDGKIYVYDARTQKEYAIIEAQLEAQKQSKEEKTDFSEENLPTIKPQVNTEESKEKEVTTEKETTTEKGKPNSESAKENETTATSEVKEEKPEAKAEANEEVKESK